MAPVRVSVPAVMVRPPVPPMAPEKVPLAEDSVKVWDPRVTVPEPARLTIETSPPVWAEMLKVPPLSCTFEPAIAAVPVNNRVAVLMVVVPV